MLIYLHLYQHLSTYFDILDVILMDGWINSVLGHIICTVKVELGLGQPGLIRWIWDETLPKCSIDRMTLHTASHCATKWAGGRPL